MAYKNTIAKNHLSNESTLANKGRYGDTEIARTSKGEMWHVNPQEKSLMNMYGMEGERMVDAAGSGTTNPQTGLEEKFLPALVAAAPAISAIGAGASAVIGGISSYTGGREKEIQAGATIKAADQGLERLAQTEAGLEKGKGARQLTVTQDYDMESGKFSAEIGVSKEDIGEQTSQAIQKSGLVTSGTVQEKRSSMWDRVQGMFQRGRKGLIADLGKKMGDIERWYEGEKSRISSERQKFQNQKDLAKEQEGSWYLGKNIGKAGRWLTGK